MARHAGSLPVVVSTLWVVLRLCHLPTPVLADGLASDVPAEETAIPAALGEKHSLLSAATTRVASAVTSFGLLREVLASEPAASFSAGLQGLLPEEVAFFTGEGPQSQEFQERFVNLQERSTEIQSQSDQGRVDEEAMVALTADLEKFAHDLEVRLARVRLAVLPRLSPTSRQRLQNGGNPMITPTPVATMAPPTVAPPLPKVQAPVGGGTPRVLKKYPRPTSRLPAEAEEWSKKTLVDLAKLNEAAKAVGSGALIAASRRLAAKYAQVVDSDQPGGETLEALSREITLALVTGGTEVYSAPTTPEATAAKPPADPDVVIEGCSASAIRKASSDFDKHLKGFTKPIVQSMLPPEVEGLHRVVHTMQALKSSLLGQLGSPDPWSKAAEIVADCRRYFAGVGQLEADLNRYRSMAGQVAAGDLDSGLQEEASAWNSNPRADLSSLEVSPNALAGGGQRALSAQSFR